MPARQTRTLGAVAALLLALLLPPFFVRAQDVGVAGTRRPYRLYVGDGFLKAESNYQEEFVEIYSHYLAGHPQKYALIDLYNANAGESVGEYGWSGFMHYKTTADSPGDRRSEAS